MCSPTDHGISLNHGRGISAHIHYTLLSWLGKGQPGVSLLKLFEDIKFHIGEYCFARYLTKYFIEKVMIYDVV